MRVWKLVTTAAVLTVMVALLSACGGSNGDKEPTNEPEAKPTRAKGLDIERLSESVVMVAPGVFSGDEFEPVATGSGTIVDKNGLILTNFHVVDPDGVGEYEDIAIYVSDDAEEMPDLKYFGGLAAWDDDLDLAVVRITRNRNGIEIDPEELDLERVDIGDADDLEIGDELAVLGYPAIGEGSMELTKGSVSGFVAAEGRKQAWIKTDARIAAGNSGGGAFDKSGDLIGIPTAVYYVQELGSEGSGRLRPVNLALDLLDEAEETTSAVIPSPGEVPAGEMVEADLPLLEAIDIGSDFALSGEVYLTNEDRASWYEDPQEAIDFYEGYGRLGGVRRVFDNTSVAEATGTVPVFIIAQIDVYETDQGATDAVSGTCDEFLDTMWEFVNAVGFEFYEPEYVSDPGVGEEGCAYVAEEIVASADEPPLLLAFVGFRQGPVLAVIGALTLEENMSYEGLDYLAALQGNLIAGELGMAPSSRTATGNWGSPQAPQAPVRKPENPSVPPPPPPAPTPIGYFTPEDAIQSYLAAYGLWYAGDCAWADPQTDMGYYCSAIYEDRGAEKLYLVGLTFSEPEACILVEGFPDGSWAAIDDIALSYNEWGEMLPCPW